MAAALVPVAGKIAVTAVAVAAALALAVSPVTMTTVAVVAVAAVLVVVVTVTAVLRADLCFYSPASSSCRAASSSTGMSAPRR